MRPDLLRFEDPFRPIYEQYAVAGWGVSAIALGIASALSPFPTSTFLTYASIAGAMAMYRHRKGKKLAYKQSLLDGVPLSFMTRKELAAITANNKDKFFVGYGFPWSREEAQIAHTLKRYDPERMLPREEGQMGQRWIHGLGVENEIPLYIKFEHLGGHTLIVGTTGSGKTRMLDTLITQAISMGVPVICVDPKADRDLCDAMRNACIELGREEDFVYFHPAHPERSVRIDPLKNFNRSTELATRIATLIMKGTGTDPFVNFGQMAMDNLAGGLLFLETKPSIAKIRALLETGFEGLLHKCFEKHYESLFPNDKWREEVRPYLSAAQSATKGTPQGKILAGYIQYYRDKARLIKSAEVIEGLIGAYEHDREHMGKMLVSLAPILKQLTSGPLNGLLSPDYDDLDDERRITDFAKILRNNQVAYIALDSMSDAMVASCMGALFFTDMASVAGERYNFADKSQLTPYVVVSEESSETVCGPFLQLLNKARGSGANIFVLTQAVSDFAARSGSKDEAMSMLGNLNNMFALRVKDVETQKYIAEQMPETVVRSIQIGQSVKTETDHPLLFSSTISESLKEETVPLVEPAMFNCLSNLEFFAIVSGGLVCKCRIPILRDEPARGPTCH